MLLLWLPEWHRGKESACQGRRRKRHGFDPWVGKLPWRRNGNTPVFLPGKSHGPRSLAGYSPLGCKESDMTEWLSVHTRNAACYLFILSSKKKRWPKLFLSIAYAFFVGNKKGRRNFQDKSIIKNTIYFKRISYCNRMKMEVWSYLRLPVHTSCSVVTDSLRSHGL